MKLSSLLLSLAVLCFSFAAVADNELDVPDASASVTECAQEATVVTEG